MMTFVAPGPATEFAQSNAIERMLISTRMGRLTESDDAENRFLARASVDTVTPFAARPLNDARCRAS